VPETPAPERGRWIVAAAWASVALFAAVAVPDALGADAFDDVVVGVSVGLFLVSLPVWAYAFVLAVVRSARGDDIAVASLFFLSGSAPARVRRRLLGATVASVATAVVTAAANPFAVLVPMLPLGLAGMWGARYGTYPPRRVRPAPRGGRT
jgi:hypothetical protein